MVLDTSALLGILLGEAEGEAMAARLAAAQAPVICAPNWLEAMMVITTRLGPQGAVALAELLAAAELQIQPADEAIAVAAYDAWMRFGKGRHKACLNFGDCFAYALAVRRGEPLLFKGEDFVHTDVART